MWIFNLWYEVGNKPYRTLLWFQLVKKMRFQKTWRFWNKKSSLCRYSILSVINNRQLAICWLKDSTEEFVERSVKEKIMVFNFKAPTGIIYIKIFDLSVQQASSVFTSTLKLILQAVWNKNALS